MATYPPLFQFRKIDNFLFQSLINKTLWFSSPSVFNDPFDCQLPVQVDNSLEEITKYLLQLNCKTKYYPKKQQVVERARILKQDTDYLKNFLRNKFFNERRFSCFVTKEDLVYNNSKMWGYYADKHRGVCLKLQFDEEIEKSFELEPGIKINPLEIKYERAIPRFNYIRYKLNIKQDLNSSNQYFLGTKSDDWRDESEVRLILEKLSGQFDSEYVEVKFKPEYLKEVIFGCNSTEENRNTIREIIKCNSEYSHVKIFQIEKSEKFFGFELK